MWVLVMSKVCCLPDVLLTCYSFCVHTRMSGCDPGFHPLLLPEENQLLQHSWHFWSENVLHSTRTV